LWSSDDRIGDLVNANDVVMGKKNWACIVKYRKQDEDDGGVLMTIR
jgi:hypothetical protein